MEKSNQEIEQDILIGPHRTYECAKAAMIAERDYRIEKVRLEKEKAKAYLVAKANFKLEKPTVRELESMVEEQCYEQSIKLLEAESYWKLKVIEWDKAKDSWDAARSALRFRVEEMKQGVNG